MLEEVIIDIDEDFTEVFDMDDLVDPDEDDLHYISKLQKKENQDYITAVFVYISNKNDISNVIKKKITLPVIEGNSTITKEVLLKEIQKHKILYGEETAIVSKRKTAKNHYIRYFISELLLYVIGLDSSNLLCTEAELESGVFFDKNGDEWKNRIVPLSFFNDIIVPPSLSAFHPDNTIFFLFKEGRL